mmetsp:Transcript_75719/g.239436  ORF Transcript_75719/g.239436 Transcript_75719/m.239436 type:complete len:219 (-) Transcript_75719:3-659(-)
MPALGQRRDVEAIKPALRSVIPQGALLEADGDAGIRLIAVDEVPPGPVAVERCERPERDCPLRAKLHRRGKPQGAAPAELNAAAALHSHGPHLRLMVELPRLPADGLDTQAPRVVERQPQALVRQLLHVDHHELHPCRHVAAFLQRPRSVNHHDRTYRNQALAVMGHAQRRSDAGLQALGGVDLRLHLQAAEWGLIPACAAAKAPDVHADTHCSSQVA